MEDAVRVKSITVTAEAHEALRVWAFHENRSQQDLASLAIMQASGNRAARYKEALQRRRQPATNNRGED